MKFINISNHPHSQWSEKQKEEALIWCSNGELIDIPFPQVPATATRWDVSILADYLIEDIMKTCHREKAVIHIMGEQGLTYQVVSLLKKYYPQMLVVHSTTERVVIEKHAENGSTEKVSVFQFVQFRLY